MTADPENPCCPHCGGRMLKWATPELNTWSAEFQYICFNDECSYYVRGWTWMKERYNVTGSYRHRLDPTTGHGGPIPVWSAAALRDGIITVQGEDGGSPHGR